MHYKIEGRSVILEDLFSGYGAEYIDGSKKSKWDDVGLHRIFLENFSQK